MENNGKKYYIIAFGLIITIIGIVFIYLFSAYNRTEAKVSEYQSQVQEVKDSIGDLKTDMAIIKADLVWIKLELSKQK